MLRKLIIKDLFIYSIDILVTYTQTPSSDILFSDGRREESVFSNFFLKVDIFISNLTWFVDKLLSCL